MKKLDIKISKLLDLGLNLPFVEHYPHEKTDCFKILNPYTKYAKEKLVLCRVDKGFDKALDLAITAAIKWKADFDKK